eukprot:TRINITY_DN47809_c0_g1_i1.p1 TRINITY_DN47809_c0_g1~~TRINITY_DN47809_c0_g1_i1.p1  ORF type:complete len:186 (-),score=26.73 TRINITY_DN47809_c0_g1_i1:35-592(-)
MSLSTLGNLVNELAMSLLGIRSIFPITGTVFQCSEDALNEEIEYYSVHSCRILHGAYSWLASFGKSVFSLGRAPPLEHHWGCLKTTSGKLYNIQIYGDRIELTEHSCAEQVRNRGFDSANRAYDSQHWVEYQFLPKDGTTATIGTVKKWLDEEVFERHYDLVNHNCQHFCRSLYDHLVLNLHLKN